MQTLEMSYSDYGELKGELKGKLKGEAEGIVKGKIESKIQADIDKIKSLLATYKKFNQVCTLDDLIPEVTLPSDI